MEKFNQIRMKDRKRIYLTEGEVPLDDSVKVLSVGEQAVIRNNKILSNMTQGILTGLFKNRAGNMLAKVHWLEGAPPICIRAEYVFPNVARKFWMVAPSLHGRQSDANLYSTMVDGSSRRHGTNPPIRRFYDHQEAIRVAEEQSSRYGFDFIVLESVEVVGNRSGVTAL